MRVLCVIDSSLTLREMTALANAVTRTAAGLEFVAVFCDPGLRPGDGSGVFGSAHSFPVPKNGLCERLGGGRRSIGVTPLFGLFRFLGLRNRFKRELAIAREFLRIVSADRVLLPSDRSLGPSLALAKAARDLGIPIIIPPIAVSSSVGPSQMRGKARIYRASGWRAPIWNRWVARVSPKQARDSSFGRQLFFPGPVYSALRAAGMLPSSPWGLGASFAQKVCVANTIDVRRLTDDGLAPEKIRVTGNINYDELFSGMKRREAIRAALVEQFGLAPGKKWLILAAPQFAEHGLLPWEEHWREQRFLASACVAAGFEVLVSLHPKCDAAAYRFLESDFGCRIVPQPVREYLPAADLFVSGYSSVVEWAAACGIPSVVCDFFAYAYPIFSHIRGVEIYPEREAFRRRLRELFADPTELVRLSEVTARENAWTVNVDGKAAQRIRDEILALPDVDSSIRA